MSEQARIEVTIRVRLEKFKGDVSPGDKPVEVIERKETLALEKFDATNKCWT